MTGERARQAASLALEEAIRYGDLGACRRILGDAAGFPNVDDPSVPIPLLVLAIYHGPPAFIEELLRLGADPNAPAADGFPALYAAVISERPDRHTVVTALLAAGADPDQRGINDYTCLHAAAGRGDVRMVEMLLAAGADRTLRTRIDERQTAAEMAAQAGHQDVVRVFSARCSP